MNFDDYAANYTATLNSALSISGETGDYFARGRMVWLSALLRTRGIHEPAVLDFGCGNGSTTPLLLEHLAAAHVTGVDVSAESIANAARSYTTPRARFLTLDQYTVRGEYDLAYCNCVFHHIPVIERHAALATVRESLRPGGLFSFWENNPHNPGTRFVMRRCEFDADAITITPAGARTMLRAAGFEILRTDFLFIFPRWLKPLRFLEPIFRRLPIGAQYHILCRAPERRRAAA